jgi:esterase/lipase superfamily enzyme
MLFITNRVLQEGPTPITNRATTSIPASGRSGNTYTVPRSINFDLRNNQAEQSIYFCRHDAGSSYTEIGSQVFFEQVKNSSSKQILIYIHGFSNLPTTALQKAAELQTLLNQKSSGVVQVIPLIWPCDNDFGLVQDYFDDQIAADASAYAFARLLEKFLQWRHDHNALERTAEGNLTAPCTKAINILAHSMGNRVLRGTFALAVKYYQPQGLPLLFRNIFMASADIDNRSFESGQDGEYISQASRNVVVYHAADDLAMRASKVANVRDATQRLGHTGPQDLDKAAKNIYALDCADFNNIYDPPTGHGYFTRDRSDGPGVVFDHIWKCLETGRVPMTTPSTRRQILKDTTPRFWQTNNFQQ